MTFRALTRCPRCGTNLTSENVTGTTKFDERHTTVGMVCHECELSATMKVLTSLWKSMIKEEKLPDVKVDERKQPEGRRIGQVVKAFREVELVNVVTVEDITWIWDYQSKVAPETVPVEV